MPLSLKRLSVDRNLSKMATATKFKVKASYFFLLMFYEFVILCFSWPAVVSSFNVPRIPRLSSSSSSSSSCSSNDIDHSASLDKYGRTSTMDIEEDAKKIESELSCRVIGFYPFPTSKSRTPLEWLLKDTHQAIVVTETIKGDKAMETTSVRMDFMTKDGASHPVWYDEATKWNVFFGGSIDGEVRLKALKPRKRQQKTNLPKESYPMGTSKLDSNHSKLDRLISYANDYDCRMNLYTNNCRMFAARMEREVERLKMEGMDGKDSSLHNVVTNVRYVLRILWAAILPMIYPAGTLLLLCKGAGV